MQAIRQIWVNLRSSLWFVPGLMVVSSICLAIFLIEIDSNIKREWLINYPRLFGLGADGSRGMLTAIAGSMLTVATLAFSLTLSIIAQASGQYSPRVLRNFMRDRINQFILGYFVSVFAYSLIILRTIRGDNELTFVPSLGVIIGLVLAIGGIVVLIFFIHHIASSLQVTNIIKDIEVETVEVIDEIFPEALGIEAETEQIRKAKALEDKVSWYKVKAIRSGYIQYVDADNLLNFAVENDLLVRMEYGIGQFVTEGTTLVSVSKDPGEDEISEINSYFDVYRYRTIEQDAGFGIRQIVDIALKALSPGINDTTTAIICIDYLGVILSKIAERQLPAPVRLKDGEIRVLVKSPTFEGYIETAFDQIRINGKGNLAILVRLLNVFSVIDEKINSESRKSIVEHQIKLTRDFALETLQTDHEKKSFNRFFAEKLKIINEEK